jgi:hypothetical protein
VSEYYTGSSPPTELGAVRCKHQQRVVGESWCVNIVIRTRVPLSSFQFQLNMCPPHILNSDRVGDPSAYASTSAFASPEPAVGMHTREAGGAGVAGVPTANGGIAGHAGFKMVLQAAATPRRNGALHSCYSFRVLGSSATGDTDTSDAQLLTRLMLPMPLAAHNIGASSAQHAHIDSQFLPPTPMPIEVKVAHYVPTISHAAVGMP